MSDDLPGAYGWLDDWLVLASSRWLYVRPPDPARMSEFAAHTRRVWSALPPSVLPALMQFVGQIEPERAALAAVPLPKLRAILEQQLASPAPFRITVPPYQPVGAPRDPMGGRVTTAHGMQWSDGKAMQFSFEGADRSGSRAAGRSSADLDRRSAARCIRRAPRLVEPGTV